jgi:hypothetical protein
MRSGSCHARIRSTEPSHSSTNVRIRIGRAVDSSCPRVAATLLRTRRATRPSSPLRAPACRGSCIQARGCRDRWFHRAQCTMRWADTEGAGPLTRKSCSPHRGRGSCLRVPVFHDRWGVARSSLPSKRPSGVRTRRMSNIGSMGFSIPWPRKEPSRSASDGRGHRMRAQTTRARVVSRGRGQRPK